MGAEIVGQPEVSFSGAPQHELLVKQCHPEHLASSEVG
ncbi:unannotated protein [freshwater metagenome]|uniref:Unannotated protein n=1 Tax=freshwater metagenome TaxID=449393 RepID=A0A6J7N9I9_9ZZZZ